MNRLDTKLSNINKSDLLHVILYGAILPLLLGLLYGMVDYFLISRLGFSLGALLFFLTANYIGGTVRKIAPEPHLVYTSIAGVFLVIQVILILVVPYLYAYYDATNEIRVFADISQYYAVLRYVVLNMLNNFRFDYIILLLFYAVGTYVGVSRTYR